MSSVYFTPESFGINQIPWDTATPDNENKIDRTVPYLMIFNIL